MSNASSPSSKTPRRRSSVGGNSPSAESSFFQQRRGSQRGETIAYSPTSGGSPSFRGGNVENIKDAVRASAAPEEARQSYQDQKRLLRQMLVAHAAEVLQKDHELHQLKQSIRKLTGLIQERDLREPE